MVSNGAFALSEWVQGEHISTVRNSFYWANDANRLDGVRWLQISDENAEYLRYRGDQLDVTASVPIAQLARENPRCLEAGFEREDVCHVLQVSGSGPLAWSKRGP